MSMWTFREPSIEEIRKAKARAQLSVREPFRRMPNSRVCLTSPGQKFLKYLELVKEEISQWPIAVQNISLTVSAFVGSFYYDASEGRRLCWSICALNTVIFLIWKIPRFHTFMNRAFTHDPLSGKSYTLLTSMFRCVLVHEGWFWFGSKCMSVTRVSFTLSPIRWRWRALVRT